MSTHSFVRNRLVGLTAPGLLGLVALGVIQAAPQQPGPEPASTAPASQDEGGPPVRHVLLTDGRIYAGEVTHDGGKTIVKLKGGLVTLTKSQLEGTFESIAAIYQYKLDRIADDDPEEHFKLANWCIARKLDAEATTELKKVLSMEPGNRQAKAQLFNLEANETRRAQAKVKAKADPSRVDPSLVRTSVDLNQPRPVAAGPPTIFDLPPASALQRYREFALTVHGELQRRCASCHNEASGLSFQLVRAATPREQMNDLVLRTNLEATLPLIDRADPDRSPLLTAAVLPHQGRSILGSPNHPAYRAWSQWISGIVETPATANPVSGTAASAGGFGSRRSNGAAPVASVADTPVEPSTLDAQVQAAAARVRRQAIDTGEVRHPSVPDSAQFPTPGIPTVGPGGRVGTIPMPATTPNPKAGAAPKGSLPPGLPPLPPGFEIDPESDPNLKPMANPRRPDPKNLYPAEFDNKKGSGKSRINLDTLERFMKPGPGPESPVPPAAPPVPPVPTPTPR